MDNIKKANAVYEMLAVCRAFSPDIKKQEAFTKIYNEWKSEGKEPEFIVNHLAYALTDGLTYENWPT